MSHQPAANPGAQAGNPVRERPVTIQHHLDKEAPKAKRTATDKLVEKIRPASALFSQEASRNETGKLEVALNKCSLMDMPNEILSNIADELILSSLSDADNYELDGDDEKPRNQKRLRYIQKYPLRNSEHSSTANWVDRICSMSQYEVRFQGMDYHWKILWNDLGLANTNKILREIVWPRVNAMTLQERKPYFETVIKKRTERMHAEMDWWLKNLQREHLKVWHHRLTLPSPTWNMVKNGYVVEGKRITHADFSKMHEGRLKKVHPREIWKWAILEVKGRAVSTEGSGH